MRTSMIIWWRWESNQSKLTAPGRRFSKHLTTRKKSKRLCSFWTVIHNRRKNLRVRSLWHSVKMSASLIYRLWKGTCRQIKTSISHITWEVNVTVLRNTIVSDLNRILTRKRSRLQSAPWTLVSIKFVGWKGLSSQAARSKESLSQEPWLSCLK